MAKDPSWQSKAWILERRFPNAWGRKGRIEGEMKHDHKHTVNNREDILYKFYEKLEVDDLETLLKLMQEIDAEKENKKLN